MTEMRVTTVETMVQWQTLENQWNPLLAQSRTKTSFLTMEWLTAWAKTYLTANQRLHILLFHEKEKLVAAAPLYTSVKSMGPLKFVEIRFIGSPMAGSDYLDVIILKGREKAVAEIFYQHIKYSGWSAWDMLLLQDIPAESLFLHHLLKQIKLDGKYAELSAGSYCPFANLNGGYDQYFAGLSRGRKKKLKQDIRVINREAKVKHLVHQNGEVKHNLPKFFEFYAKKSGRPASNLWNMMRIYIDQCKEDIPVQIDFLEVNGKTVAGLLHLKYSSVLGMYLMAVDRDAYPKLSLGNLLVGMCIRNAANDGYTVYDFLKGDEGYKFHWANSGNRTLKLEFWKKNPTAVMLGLINILKNAGKILLR